LDIQRNPRNNWTTTDSDFIIGQAQPNVQSKSSWARYTPSVGPDGLDRWSEFPSSRGADCEDSLALEKQLPLSLVQEGSKEESSFVKQEESSTIKDPHSSSNSLSS